ncbi:MAG TPA: hypothetical protein VKB34_19245, partial [Povalibacter sp.]|nr:hypothetical protein [Povalibacter sp.]
MTTQSRLQSLMSKLANGEQLSTILIAAVVQGWALYGLHIAIDRNRWPATSSGWLIGLYAVAAFVPLTVQLLARHSRRALMWTIVAAVGVFCLFAGWHHGEWVMADDARQVPESGEWFLLA